MFDSVASISNATISLEVLRSATIAASPRYVIVMNKNNKSAVNKIIYQPEEVLENFGSAQGAEMKETHVERDGFRLVLEASSISTAMIATKCRKEKRNPAHRSVLFHSLSPSRNTRFLPRSLASRVWVRVFSLFLDLFFPPLHRGKELCKLRSAQIVGDFSIAFSTRFSFPFVGPCWFYSFQLYCSQYAVCLPAVTISIGTFLPHFSLSYISLLFCTLERSTLCAPCLQF